MSSIEDTAPLPLSPPDTEAGVIAQLARAGVPPTSIPTHELRVAVHINPVTGSPEVINNERYLRAPSRITGSVQLHTVDDLVTYVQRHDDPQATTVWVSAIDHQIVAVLNDHTSARIDAPSGPGWGDHRAVVALIQTPEWKDWTGNDGATMTQARFADFLQRRSVDLHEPTSGEMLEIAQTLQGKVGVDWTAATRLSDGQVQASYVETRTAVAGQKGELKIPEQFTIAVAPFLGEDLYKVTARLRYRMTAGEISIGYALERPDDIIRDALMQITDRLGDQFPGGRVFLGEPAPSR